METRPRKGSAFALAVLTLVGCGNGLAGSVLILTEARGIANKDVCSKALF